MPTYQGSTVVKRRPKDGEQGIQGPLMVQKEWVQGDTHRYTDEVREYFYVRGADAAQSHWYTLINKGTVIADAPPTGGIAPAGYKNVQWLKELSVQFFIAEEANLANLIFKDQKLISLRGTVNGVAADYSGQVNFEPNIIIDGKNGKITAIDATIRGTIHATKGVIDEDVIIKGTLSGVIGTFKRLECIDDNGNNLGSIRFAEAGSSISFHGCTISHEVPTGPFYARDIWVRGVLGVCERTAIVITGTGTSARVYKEGLSAYGELFYLTRIPYTSDEIYRIPLYAATSLSLQTPIDIVIINHSTSRNYDLQAAVPGKVVIVINSNDAHNDIWIYCNGVRTKIEGGAAAMLVNVGGFQTPDYDSRIGHGWFVVGMWDNNWD